MCGIAGLAAPDLAPSERLALVRTMVARLRHRGPSGEAVHDAGDCALGIARLAIVAPDAPAQVLRNETGDVVGVANGEIYNHRALEQRLLERGHTFTPGPDTALLPHLYEERGPDLAEALDGMFAIALWDRWAGTLTLARDRAGEKPLFVHAHGRRFAFASEPAALLALPWVTREPDPAALARFLVHGAFAGADSAYAGIRQLPPAHSLVVRDGVERLRRWWRPWDTLVHAPAGSALPVDRSDAGVIAATREALAEAVATRVPAEVPFGVFLSGGVDSGVVAVLAARAHGRRFPTFSMRIAHPGYDEAPIARRVAESIGSDHHEVSMDAAAAERAFRDWVAGMDQPLGDPSLLPTWLLAEHASRHVPVVLTGEGGDELFAGYPTYLGHRHVALANGLPAPIASLALGLARRFRPRHHHVTIAHLLERFLGVRGLSPYERHLAWFGTARPSEALRLLAPALRAQVTTDEPLAHARRLERQLADLDLLRAGTTPDLVAYQLLDFETYLSGDLLTKVDRCTMAHGVESRSPFLRHSLVAHALGLPEHARLRGTSGKWALKQAARSLLPAEVLDRRKQGFSPPFSTWSRGPLRGLVLDALSPARVARAGVLDPAVVQGVVREHLEGHEDRGRTLWTLLALQSWADRWLAGTTAPASATSEPATAR
ncbi:MAG: asparagine synthase (glutamine-hydrolyzing) [bacterium]